MPVVWPYLVAFFLVFSRFFMKLMLLGYSRFEFLGVQSQHVFGPHRCLPSVRVNTIKSTQDKTHAYIRTHQRRSNERRNTWTTGTRTRVHPRNHNLSRHRYIGERLSSTGSASQKHLGQSDGPGGLIQRQPFLGVGQEVLHVGLHVLSQSRGLIGG